MKSFLAAGDVLINPSLLAYAVVETDSDGPQLRLGFSGQAGDARCEVRLTGLEARSVLRWLRVNSEFLDAGSPTRRLDRMSGLVAPEAVDSKAVCRPALAVSRMN
jgi:hypothetical protein